MGLHRGHGAGLSRNVLGVERKMPPAQRWGGDAAVIKHKIEIRKAMRTARGPLPVMEISLRTAAIVAGLGLLAMAILSPFAYLNVVQKLIVPGDANTTAANIMASSGLFRIAILCLLVVAILDILVAWALYVLLKPANKNLSLLAAWFRVVYAAIFAVVLINLFSALQILSGAGYLKIFEAAQLHAQAMVWLRAFAVGWDVGLVILGLHLLILGYLVFQSGYIPRWLGILLVVAALGYVVDSVGRLLFPGYNVTLAMFTFVGEVVLIFWLLWKGAKGFDKGLEESARAVQ
jgi:hypothetical protein